MWEAYSVAIRVGLINGVASGLTSMVRQFKTADMAAIGLQKRLKEIKGLMLVGGVTAGAGLAIAAALEKTVKPASEITRQMSLLNTLGMKQKDVAAAVAAAWKTSFEVPTTTVAKNLEAFRELRSAFGMGHEREAAAVLPTVGRMDAIQYALTGKHQDRVGFDMVKAIELRTGVMTQEALQRNADRMGQAILGMSGTISVSDFHGALKMGKMATQKWTDDFVYGYLPTLMQEMKVGHGGAQTAGTALMSFYQQAHGRMTKAAMPFWVASGLISPHDIVRTAGGQWQMKPGAVKGTSTLEANPFQWVQQYLAPGVARIMANKHVSAETAVNAMFSNRNAAFAAYNMLQKAQQYERDKRTIDAANDPLKAYNKLKASNPQIAAMALQARWNDIMAQLGLVIMPQLLKAAELLLPPLIRLGEWMRDNPKAVSALTIGLEALSGALIAGGTVSMIGALAKGFGLLMKIFPVLAIAGEAVGGAVTLIAAALGAPVWLVGAAIAAGIAAIAGALWAFTHWDQVKEAISDAFNFIVSAAKDLWAQLTGQQKPKPGQGYQGLTQNRAHGNYGYGPHGESPFNHKSAYVRPGASGGAAVTKTADVYLDGHKVGRVLGRQLGGVYGGTTSFDPSLDLTPVGGSYSA